ncbi:acyl-CoA/acyl-ACP dehydrogenase [Pseudomonas capeferrum]|uniref:acyl-CoA dehydrogenase family protein n=1 Tax=Pseudomonas capeferrum TaxID=1495066 RepID=UPI0015E28148|nr:acyl-CoA dehydrogenase family protein [Pseudomonas capeferrum]MBA1204237.1 acyl-CoA/acyl-ACP dehydrogenase [Pseudomonas capeferrum]
MQADHAEDLASIREQARRLLVDQATPEHLKNLLNAPGSFDQALWRHAVEQGWPSVAMPEQVGGLALGWSGLAVICEELGRLTGALPLIANALTAHAVISAGISGHQQLLEDLTSGALTAALALADPSDSGICSPGAAKESNGRIDGVKALAAFAAVADVALVHGVNERGDGLYLVHLDQPSVKRQVLEGFDNARAAAALQFEQTEAVYLGGAELVSEISSLAALATAFEQLGGTHACLDMACDYARERRAFGQAIGGFQGIKHKLAEIYCLLEIARGCAADALDAWQQQRPDKQQLTCAARIAATRAYNLAAQENLHVHGGMGVTWEAMPHHYYRRARSLALELGSVAYWRERLLTDLGLESTTVEVGGSA